jgi:type III secretion protein J
LFILLFAAVLAGCNGVDLYSQLSERQANEMVAALQSVGIEADKRSKDGHTWSVQVARESFARAVDTLRANGFPRDEFDSLGKVFKKEGFVSSPLEERARLIYGLSQELSNTISAIDGVVMARVHLAVPEKDPLTDKPRSASASVMVKHRAGVDLSGQVGQIKALVVNSVEGLPYDNVTVALFAAQDSPSVPVASAPSASQVTGWSARDQKRLVAAGYVAVAVLAIVVLLSWWHRGRGARRRSGRALQRRAG